MLIRMVLSAGVHIHACPSYNPKLQGFRWHQSRPPCFTYSKKPLLMISNWLYDASVCCFWLSLCSWWSEGPSDSMRESTMLYNWFLTHIPSGVDLLFRECSAARPIHFLDTSGQYEEISLCTQSSPVCKNQYLRCKACSLKTHHCSHLLQMHCRIIQARPYTEGALLRQAYFSRAEMKMKFSVDFNLCIGLKCDK